MDVRLVSLGTLPLHPLRGEREPRRTGHATTTLLRTPDRVLLVDPGLPEPALAARLDERAGLSLRDVTHVFLTSFNPDTRRALPALTHATWWIHAAEREQVGVTLASHLRHLAQTGQAPTPQAQALTHEVALLHRTVPAPDTLLVHGAERVDLFPLPGVTPGLAGLLVALPRYTLLICGDAIPTIEHLEQGQILPDSTNIDRARESFAEAVEIADLLILGRDGLVVNPTRRAL